MIYSYGVTQQGACHVKNNIVCQDSHYFKIISKNYAIGAVADGLGSELYTDVASKIAAEKSVAYCIEKIKQNDNKESILKTISESFRYALNEINRTAKDNGHDVDQYDTTLALAVYIDGDLYYGNSGDSGIVVLNQDGTYESVTTQQKDENGCVYPLFFGEEKWDFGAKENVASVFLATDGMYETLFPYLLKGEDVSIYVALAQFLMSEESLNFSSNKEKDVQARMNDFVASIPGDQVSDDKTVLVMLDTSVKTEKQPDEYYSMPDWAALKKKREEEYKRAAYPHLYSNEDSTKKGD